MVLNGLEREQLRNWKGYGKVTFTRPFLMLDKVTFDEHVCVWERYCKGDNYRIHIYTTLMALFPKLKVFKGLISRSDNSINRNNVDISHIVIQRE